MKAASSKKSSTTTSTTATQAANQPFFAKAGGGNFFAPVTSTVTPAIQMKMAVNKPGDKFEQEADKMADKVMRMPAPISPVKEEKLQRAPEEKLQKKEEDKIQKAPAEDKLQRKGGDGAPSVGTSTQSAIQNKTTGGQALSSDVRSYMEPRFNADFSNVRVHSDPEAASLSNQLSARAFTYQNHIFFSRDQYQPGTSEGKQLLAHELTHTVQQGHAVQRSPQISNTVTPPPVQRLGMQDALDYFADKANFIPGFRMLTILLGFNPINMRAADRNAANLLRALIELIPGGAFITQALDNHGVINKAAAWVEQKIATLGDIGSDIVAGLKRFIDSLSWRDIFDLSGVWDRAKSIFTNPISRLINFGISVASEILKMVKDAILKPLATLAQGTNGYDLLKATLGEDPITGEPVPRNAENLLGGFMKFIGQAEIWENIKKGNAIAKAWAWFQGALEGLMGFVRTIPARIINTFTSLTFQDIITVAGAFGKIVGAFVNIATDFISWGLKQVLSLLEILFSVVAPGVMPYIKKAQAAFVTIIKNPIGFVNNLVRAGKQGFEMFAANILTHLKTALIKWITGPLGDAGVYIPKSFDLMEIIKLVLSVLGLTWQNIRGKLVKIIPEPVLVGLEKTAGILVTLVKDGPAAAWEQIKTELSELKDQMIAQVTQMISTEVVKAAVTKLVMMLNPAGAVVQAIIAIYKTVTFFIEKIQQIAAVVASFIDSISAIAAGQVASAAKRVEQTMANTLTVIIAFLANFAGLGNIPEKIVGIVKKIRAPIDKGLDKIVAWLGAMLRNLASRALGADPTVPPQQRLDRGIAEAQVAVNRFAGRRVGALVLKPLLATIRMRYQLTSLDAIVDGTRWVLLGKVNPEKRGSTNAQVESGAAGTDSQSTPPIFGGTNGGFGTSVRVANLTKNHAKGSSPSVDGGHWDILRSRMDGGSTYYVRGHLLNDNLGGTGADWKNLTPLTQAANNRSALSMLHTFESPVKNAVNKGDSVDFVVTINYGRPARNDVAEEARKKIQPEGDAIAKIIEAEQHVPTSVQGIAKLIAANGTTTPLVSSSTTNSIDVNLDHYTISASKRRHLQINSASVTELKALNGIDAAIAEKIISVRPLIDKADARRKLGDSIWHAMASTAGVSIRFK